MTDPKSALRALKDFYDGLTPTEYFRHLEQANHGVSVESEKVASAGAYPSTHSEAEGPRLSAPHQPWSLRDLVGRPRRPQSLRRNDHGSERSGRRDHKKFAVMALSFVLVTVVLASLVTIRQRDNRIADLEQQGQVSREALDDASRQFETLMTQMEQVKDIAQDIEAIKDEAGKVESKLDEARAHLEYVAH